jgi:hypothetical protein
VPSIFARVIPGPKHPACRSGGRHARRASVSARFSRSERVGCNTSSGGNGSRISFPEQQDKVLGSWTKGAPTAAFLISVAMASVLADVRTLSKS